MFEYNTFEKKYVKFESNGKPYVVAEHFIVCIGANKVILSNGTTIEVDDKTEESLQSIIMK